jgi:hypothetical protein
MASCYGQTQQWHVGMLDTHMGSAEDCVLSQVAVDGSRYKMVLVVVRHMACLVAGRVSRHGR